MTPAQIDILARAHSRAYDVPAADGSSRSKVERGTVNDLVALAAMQG